MKLELNKILIKKNYITNPNDYDPIQYRVVGLNIVGKFSELKITLIPEKDYQEDVIANNEAIENQRLYSVFERDLISYCETIEEYNEYFNSCVDIIIKNKLAEIDRLKEKLDSLKNK